MTQVNYLTYRYSKRFSSSTLGIYLYCSYFNFSHIHFICHLSKWSCLLAYLFACKTIQFEIVFEVPIM